MWKRIASGIGQACLLSCLVTPIATSVAIAGEHDEITREVQKLQVKSLQQGILSDPELLNQVLALQSSPALQAILADPELMARIRAGDYESLMNDPRLAELAD